MRALMPLSTTIGRRACLYVFTRLSYAKYPIRLPLVLLHPFSLLLCFLSRQTTTSLFFLPKLSFFHTWPSATDLMALLDKAGRSFAFATTLIKSVGEDRMPHKALQKLLGSGVNGLDSLYEQVLSSASWTKDFHQILGTIMVLNDSKSDRKSVV